jgi:hypothetical protein
MSHSVRNLCLLGVSLVVFALIFTGSTPVKAFGPIGDDFQVNTTIAGQQDPAAVAIDDSGDFVVVWVDTNLAGNSTIIGQRYNSDGVAQFGEFQINGTSQNSPQSPAIAMDADGDFVVVWAGITFDQGGTLVFAQRYNTSATPQGNTIIVTTFSGTSLIRPSVAMDSDGDFVITWEHEISDTDIDVYARRYNALGVAQAAEFLVHAASTAKQFQPSVAMDAAGTFIVTWVLEVSLLDTDIYARHFDSAGVAQGDEFRVNIDTVGAQTSPCVAADNSGNYVITWNGEGTGDTSGQFAQRYNASNVAQGIQFLVNVTTNSGQGPGSVTMSNDGKFLVIWVNESDVFGRMYDTTGAAMFGEFRVNTETEGIQGHYPALAMDADGTHTIVAWTHYGVLTNAPDIYARRFSIDVESPTETPIPTEIPLITTTITENEFYTVSEEQRTAFPDIAQGIADFVPNGINMTIRLTGNEVGIINLTVSSANGFIVLNVTSFSEVNGVAISQNYINIINRDLAPLMTATLDAILIERFGTNQNVESVVIDNSLMTLTMQDN